MPMFSENSSTTANRTAAQRDASYGGSTTTTRASTTSNSPPSSRATNNPSSSGLGYNNSTGSAASSFSGGSSYGSSGGSRGLGFSSTSGYAGSTASHTPSASGSLASAISHGMNTRPTQLTYSGPKGSFSLNNAAWAAGGGAMQDPSAVAKISQRLGYTPVGIRTNNPGNLLDSKWQHALPGYVGPVKSPNGLTYASYTHPDYGMMAQGELLGRYYDKGLTSVNGIVNRYAPVDKNNSAAANASYKDTISSSLGVSQNAHLTRSQAISIGPTMARFENAGNAFVGGSFGGTPSIVGRTTHPVGNNPLPSPKVSQAQPQTPPPNLGTRSPTGYMGDVNSFSQPTPNLGTRAPTGYYGDINTYKPQASDYRGSPPLPTRDSAPANAPNFVSVSSVPPIPSPEPRLGSRDPTSYYGDIGSFNQPTPNLGTRTDSSYYGSTPTSKPQRDQANVQAQNYGFNVPPAYPRAPEPNLGTRSSPGYMGDVDSYKPSSPEASVSELKTAKTPTQVAEIVSKTPALSQIEKKAPGTIAALIQGLNSKGGDGKIGVNSNSIAQTIVALASDPSTNPSDVNLMIQRLFQTLGTPSTHKNIVSFA